MTSIAPQLPRVLPYYSHTIMTGLAIVVPNMTPTKPSVDLDALAELFERSTSATLYLDRVLTDDDHELLLVDYDLVAELDVTRGVDALRRATPAEISAAQA